MKYTIKKNRHYHSNLLMRLWAFVAFYPRKEIKQKVMLTKSCWYDRSVVVKSGFNKLFGGGALNHHETSARFVWQPDFDIPHQFKIHSYVYENGKWEAKYLFNMNADQYYDFTIAKDCNGYVFYWDGFYDIVKHDNPKLTKLLQFYFGGQDTAPHTMTAYMK